LEVHVRSYEADASRVERVVQELISMPVDVLVPFNAAQPAAWRLTRTIPIVCQVGGYRGGYRRDLDPGLPPNVTGINFMPTDDPAEFKALSLLKAIRPSIARVAMVGTPGTPAELNQSEVVAAARIGITLSVKNVKSIDHPEADLDEAVREGAEGLMLYPGIVDTRPVHDWARRHRIPVMYFALNAAESGGLMAHGVEPGARMDRFAYLIDRILRGAKPRDLPVEDPPAPQLLINLRAAEAIGVTVPPSLQVQATRLIR